MTKTKKYNEPIPLNVDNIQLTNCQQKDNVKDNAKNNTAHSQVESNIDEITHCPINKAGQPVEAHVR